MKLDYKEIAKIAKAVNLSERAVERLLGATSVEWRSIPSFEQIEDFDAICSEASQVKSDRFQIGLRLYQDQEKPLRWSPLFEQVLLAALREYRVTCPQIVGWMCSGAFDPKKLPDGITRGNILHASRTAARLRSRILREVGKFS